MEKKEMNKKEMLLLQVESAMDVNVKALMLAVQHYTNVKDYDDAIAYIKDLDNDSYRNVYILDHYRKYADMTPEMLDKWVDYRTGKCGEPIDAGDGKPLNPKIGGINICINDVVLGVYDNGVNIAINEGDAWLSEADVRYILRSIDVVKSMVNQLR